MRAGLILGPPGDVPPGEERRLGLTSLYERHVLPKVLDFTMRQKPIMRQRSKIVPLAEGRVLEIGIGSGLNLGFYDSSKVQALFGLDPSAELKTLAAQRAEDVGIGVEMLGLSGEEIPAEADSFDTIVMTYTLCTIPRPDIALLEMRRVLKAGGRLLYCEHGLAPDEEVRRWQNRINRGWGKISGGCNLNRRIPDLIGGAGFRLEEPETMYLPGPRPMTFNYWGSAYAD